MGRVGKSSRVKSSKMAGASRREKDLLLKRGDIQSKTLSAQENLHSRVTLPSSRSKRRVAARVSPEPFSARASRV